MEKFINVRSSWFVALFRTSVSCWSAWLFYYWKCTLLKTPTVLGELSFFQYCHFFLVYFEALFLGAHIFVIVMFSWCIDPFIIIQCSFLFLVTTSMLKSFFLDINVANTPFFGYCLCGLSFPIVLLLLSPYLCLWI